MTSNRYDRLQMGKKHKTLENNTTESDKSSFKPDFFLMGLFCGLTPVHRKKAKLSTRSGWCSKY